MVKPIVTAVDNGRVTVPEVLIEEIGLEAPLKTVAWRENGKIMMIVVPADSAEAAWGELCEGMDKLNITMSEEEVVELIHKHRREKRQEKMQHH